MRRLSTRDLDRSAAPASPLVRVALVLGTLASIRYLFLASSPAPPGARSGRGAATDLDPRRATGLACLALAALLLGELARARRAPRGLRRARAAGAGLGALVAVSTFGLALIAYDPFSPPILPPNWLSPF